MKTSLSNKPKEEVAINWEYRQLLESDECLVITNGKSNKKARQFEGVVIASFDPHFQEGDYIKTWNMDAFRFFEQQITLSN